VGVSNLTSSIRGVSGKEDIFNIRALQASYLNLNASLGVGGIGIRAASGIIEARNSGGTWNPIPTASEKSWAFTSPSGSSGTFYYGGYYAFGASHDDFSATPATSWGTANSSYAAHFMAVLGATAVDKIVLRVKGTRIQDSGVRTADYEATLAIPNAATANNYYETPEKFLGQITVKVISGTAKDMNYGWCKYWDANNTDFTIKGFEAVWLGGGNDNTPNILVRHHKATGWAYNAGAKPTPPAAVVSMNGDHVTEIKCGWK
jgi:hypothetical protein